MGIFTLLASTSQDLEGQISSLSLRSVGFATVSLVLLLLLAAYIRDRKPGLKKYIFGLIVFDVVLATMVLLVSTVYLNVSSYVGGPVHWHADIEIYACGQKQEIRDPTGFLSNKIGTATYHEHNDDRIHLEGVPLTEADASLSKFFEVIGGEITNESIAIPLNDDQQAEFGNGDSCQGQDAELQVFVYRMIKDDDGTVTDKYHQIKIPADEYVLEPHGVVPPGDCIFVEFDTPKDRTDRTCLQFDVAEDRGEVIYVGERF